MENEVGTAQIDNHVAIDDAIIYMEKSLSLLLALENKIKGTNSEEKLDDDKTNPCLTQILNEAPNRIRNMVNSINVVVDSIDNTLFNSES